MGVKDKLKKLENLLMDCGDIAHSYTHMVGEWPAGERRDEALMAGRKCGRDVSEMLLEIGKLREWL